MDFDPSQLIQIEIPKYSYLLAVCVDPETGQPLKIVDGCFVSKPDSQNESLDVVKDLLSVLCMMGDNRLPFAREAVIKHKELYKTLFSDIPRWLE